jgi:hypothetical protein
MNRKPTVTTSETPRRLPVQKRKEFETEGEFSIVCDGGAPYFLIDGCYLSEFVCRHFKMKLDDEGVADFGLCKIIIIPVKE